MPMMTGVAHSPVLQRLASAGALPAATTQEMQRSVDMFGALFDTMHAEKSVSEGMRPFFQQLESSLIKLAMSDPQFLNYPMDIHLQVGSPCIGAGTPTGAPPIDFEGTPRDPAAPDIGADEHN